MTTPQLSVDCIESVLATLVVPLVVPLVVRGVLLCNGAGGRSGPCLEVYEGVEETIEIEMAE